jgi:beta-lactamase class A
LDRGALLSADMTAVLIRAMAESPTGAQRLKAGLPAGARLAHKTGTGPDVLGLNAATNDIGIVTLPGGAKFAIAVFLAGSALPEAQREAVHARIMAILAEAAR